MVFINPGFLWGLHFSRASGIQSDFWGMNDAYFAK